MNMNCEVGYLLGVLRDATIDIRKGKNYELKISQINKDWLKFIQFLIKKNFSVAGNIIRHRKKYIHNFGFFRS